MRSLLFSSALVVCFALPAGAQGLQINPFPLQEKAPRMASEPPQKLEGAEFESFVDAVEEELEREQRKALKHDDKVEPESGGEVSPPVSTPEVEEQSSLYTEEDYRAMARAQLEYAPKPPPMPEPIPEPEAEPQAAPEKPRRVVYLVDDGQEAQAQPQVQTGTAPSAGQIDLLPEDVVVQRPVAPSPPPPAIRTKSDRSLMPKTGPYATYAASISDGGDIEHGQDTAYEPERPVKYDISSQPEMAKPQVSQQSGQWQARQGDALKDVLARWAEAHGAGFVWKTNQNFNVVRPVNASGSFENAVRMLLDQYLNHSTRPIGHLQVDDASGTKRLTVFVEEE